MYFLICEEPTVVLLRVTNLGVSLHVNTHIVTYKGCTKPCATLNLRAFIHHADQVRWKCRVSRNQNVGVAQDIGF